MPQALPAIVAIFEVTTWYVVIARTILVNVALGVLAKALTKKPKYTAPPINVTVKSTVENRRIILGHRRAGGVFAFYGTSNSGGATRDLLWYVVVLTGHQVSAITDVWIDNERIPSADINASTGEVSGKWSSRLYIWKHLGTSAQTVDTNIEPIFSEWTTDHRLRGCSYLVLKMVRNDDVFTGGAPQSVTALVDGALLYDPRLDSTNGGSGSHRASNPSTWAFSSNPALALRWYLTGGSVHNDLTTRLIMYGLREIESRSDDAYFRAAANICDESVSGVNAPPSGAQTRYACDLEVSTGEDRRTIMEAILSTMAGTVVYVHGKWRAYAGHYDGPLYSFTQNDLYGELEVQDTTSHDERYNAVAAFFINQDQQYVEATTLFRTDSAYETQDGGERIPREIDLRGVTDQYRAQRLAEIELRRSRMMRKIKLRGALNWLKVAQHETFTLSHTRYGWVNRVFRCIEREFEFAEDAGRVVITATVESAAVYADMLTADYTTGTSATDAFEVEAPDAPTALTVETFVGALRATVGLPAYFPSGAVVELWEHTASTPFSSATKIAESRSNVILAPKHDQTTRYYWARIRTSPGSVSLPFPATTGAAGAASFATDTAVTTEPADGSQFYAATTQPAIESVGLNGLASYTSPAAAPTQVDVSWTAQARISNTTSGVAVGEARLRIRVFVNSSEVFNSHLILEPFTGGSNHWGLFSGTRSFAVPAGQTIDAYIQTDRSFSTGGASPSQTMYWRAALLNLVPAKR